MMIGQGKGRELIEAEFVQLDPLIDGFVGALVELFREGDEYMILETAAGSGNLLFRFRTRLEHLARDLFLEAVEGPEMKVESTPIKRR